MKAIYFPYTFINEDVLHAMTCLFAKVRLYLPSQLDVPDTVKRAAAAGVLETRTPLEAITDVRALRGLLAECGTWARFYDRDDVTSMKSRSVRRSLPDESSALSIRDAVRRRLGPGEIRDPALGFMEAQVFLHLAQQLDVDHWDIVNRLRRVRHKETDFARELGVDTEVETDGLPTTPGGNLAAPDDPAEYMIDGRLTAWSRLFVHDPEPSGVFLTTSREALERVLTRAPSAREMLHEKRIRLPAPGESLEKEPQEGLRVFWEGLFSGDVEAPWRAVDRLEKDLRGSLGGRMELEARMTFYQVPEKDPFSFFLAMAGLRRSDLPGNIAGHPPGPTMVLGTLHVAGFP